jgi:hypothetical protein
VPLGDVQALSQAANPFADSGRQAAAHGKDILALTTIVLHTIVCRIDCVRGGVMRIGEEEYRKQLGRELSEWEKRFLRDDADKDHYIKEVSRNRRFLASGRYRSTIFGQALLTLFFLRAASLPAREELFDLPATRSDWIRLILRMLVLVWMFHFAHTVGEAMMRRDGL